MYMRAQECCLPSTLCRGGQSRNFRDIVGRKVNGKIRGCGEEPEKRKEMREEAKREAVLVEWRSKKVC